jgi:hypothetical protein
MMDDEEQEILTTVRYYSTFALVGSPSCKLAFQAKLRLFRFLTLGLFLP